ncbi:unnamed protein product [Ilex paraguariensis]|uniref:Transposase n=1 Tax=Ilex paraguariensis TaxID=185542 RepID=A0ABC8TBR1_9AQUA
MGLGYCGIVRFHLRIPNGWKILDKDEDHKVLNVYVEHTKGEVLDQSQAQSNCIPIAQKFDGGNNVGGSVVASDNALDSESSQYEEHLDNSTLDDEYFDDNEYDLDGVQLHDTMVDEDVRLRNEIEKREVVGNGTGRNKRKWVEKDNTTTMSTAEENISEDCDSDELRGIPMTPQNLGVRNYLVNHPSIRGIPVDTV